MGDIPSGKDTLPVSLFDDVTGKQVSVVDKGAEGYALRVETQTTDLPIPTGKSFLRQYISLTIPTGNTDVDTDYVVPLNETWHINKFGMGAKFPGYAILIWDPTGANEEIHKVFSESNNWEATVNKDIVGDGVKKIRIRRNSMIGNNPVVAYFTGYK